MAGFRDLSHLRARQEANDRQKYLNSWGVPYDVRQAPPDDTDWNWANMLGNLTAMGAGVPHTSNAGLDGKSYGVSYGHPEIDARLNFALRDDAEKEAIRAQVERDNAQRQYLANQNTDPYNKRGFGPLSLQAGVNF
jgi:hypothetical protein